MGPRCSPRRPDYRGLGLSLAERRGDRAVPLAVRSGVLPGPAGRQPGAGAGRRAGRRVRRGAGPPLVRRRVGQPGAAPADPPRHHPVVPVPQHVRVLDHRPVRRARSRTWRSTPTRPSPGTATACSTTPPRATTCGSSSRSGGRPARRCWPGTARAAAAGDRRRRAAPPARRLRARAARAPGRRRAPGSRRPGRRRGGGGLVRRRGRVGCSAGRDQDPAWLPADPGGAAGPAAGFTLRADARSRCATCRSGRRGGSGRAARAPPGATTAAASRSSRGCARPASPTYPAEPAGGGRDGYDDDVGDLPWEPPRSAIEFDRGPTSAIARLLVGAGGGLAWPDFAALGVPGAAAYGGGALYRGRFSGVRVLVLADQAGHDDLAWGRAFTGEAGQRFQGLLAASGITRSYLVLRTLPVDTAGLPTGKVWALADRPDVVAHPPCRHGPGARRQPRRRRGHGRPARRADRRAGSTSTASRSCRCRRGRRRARRAAWVPRPTTGCGRSASPSTSRRPVRRGTATRAQIPRADLPFGFPRWQGTSGDRVVRSKRPAGADPAARAVVQGVGAALGRLARPSLAAPLAHGPGRPGPANGRRTGHGGALHPRRPDRHDGRPVRPCTTPVASTSTGPRSPPCRRRRSPRPRGGTVRPVVRTGDTIYPGLIELHNHLSYDALPLWQVPQRFDNRGQWMRHRDYRRFVSGPAGGAGPHRRVPRGGRPLRRGQVPARRRHDLAGDDARLEHGHPPLLQGPRPQRRGRRRRRGPARRGHPRGRRREPATPAPSSRHWSASAAPRCCCTWPRASTTPPASTSGRCASGPTSGRSRRRSPASTAPA